MPKADNSRNFTQCDSLLIGDQCGAHTTPLRGGPQQHRPTLEHEAFTSRVDEDMLFYCNQRGLSNEDAQSLIINGFCKEGLPEAPPSSSPSRLPDCWS